MGKRAIDLADLGVANLSKCGYLFFDEPCDPAVLTTANACSRIGIDRFVLSCRVAPSDYKALWSNFQATFEKTTPLRCKRGRIRGLRTSVEVSDTPKVAHAADAAAPSLPAPQIAAPVIVNLEAYYGRYGHYFGAHGNGRFTACQWQRFHTLLLEHFPVPQAVSVSRIEAYCDFPLSSEYVAVLPLGSKHRLCLQENGFYYGARSSNDSLAMYEGKPILLADGLAACSHVEARVRARVAPEYLVAQVPQVFDKFGVYLAGFPYSMLHLPDAWRAADARGRQRFRDRIEPFRLHVDGPRINRALEEFAEVVIPPAFRINDSIAAPTKSNGAVDQAATGL